MNNNNNQQTVVVFNKYATPFLCEEHQDFLCKLFRILCNRRLNLSQKQHKASKLFQHYFKDKEIPDEIKKGFLELIKHLPIFREKEHKNSEGYKNCIKVVNQAFQRFDLAYQLQLNELRNLGMN